MSKKDNIKKEEPKKNHHIVSKMILKEFENDKKDVIQTISALKERYLINNVKNQIGNRTCFKILKKDMETKNDYILRHENIKKISPPNFCEDYIYSFDYDQYHKDLKKINKKEKINQPKSKIMDILEDSHADIEQYFSYAHKSMLRHGNEYNISRHGTNIAKFLRSNELRPKLFFDDLKKYELESNKIITNNFFDRIKICHWADFIKDETEQILNNNDFYEKMESIKFIKSHNLAEINKTRTRYLSFINNKSENNEGFENLLFLINETDIDFILSDNISSVYYDNFIYFKDILNLIGINKNDKRQKKINITVVSPKIAIILFNEKIEEEFIYINNPSIIKKYNSLFFENTNEWLVIKDVLKLKDEIMDIDFSKKIKNKSRVSNMLDWLNNALTLNANDNVDLNFKTINNKYFSFMNCLDKFINITIWFYENHNKNNENKIIYFCYNSKQNYIDLSYKKEDLSFFINSKDNCIYLSIDNLNISNCFYNFKNKYKLDCIIKYYEHVYKEYRIIIYLSDDKTIISFKKNI